jgi:hypothetical protein
MLKPQYCKKKKKIDRNGEKARKKKKPGTIYTIGVHDTECRGWSKHKSSCNTGHLLRNSAQRVGIIFSYCTKARNSP